MKKLFIKIFILFLPVSLYLSLLVVVDPFQYFQLPGIISLQEKKKIARKINPVLWKVLRFKEDPVDKIVLGDSRAGKFRAADIARLTGEKIFNLSFEGGTIPEMVNAFWWANKRIKIKKIYMCVNFNLFNNNNVRDRFTGVVSLLDNPLLYLISRNTTTASWYTVQSIFGDKVKKLGRPGMSRDSFWDKLLEDWSRRYYATYQYPASLYDELSKLSVFCKKNDIQLIFLIPPTHVSMQEKIDLHNLREENGRFVDALKGLGPVYDFDFPNEMTRKRENFLDPVHIRPDKIQPIIEQVWGGMPGPGKVYDLKKQ